MPLLDSPIKHILTIIRSLPHLSEANNKLIKARLKIIGKERILFIEKALIARAREGFFGYINGIDCGIEKEFEEDTQPIISVEEASFSLLNPFILEETSRILHKAFLPVFCDEDLILEQKIEKLKPLKAELTAKYSLSFRNITWLPKIIEAMEENDMPLFCFGNAHFSKKRTLTLIKLLKREGYRIKRVHTFTPIEL